MKRTIALIVAALAVSADAAVGQPVAPTVEELIQKKCSICHTGHRIYSADPARLKEIFKRMEQKDPDWFKDTDMGHLVNGLAKLLDEPQIAARRQAWEATVARGQAVFTDTVLGTTGKSCASCHKPEALRGIADSYPAYDKTAGWYVTLQERLQKMIVTKLAGPEIPLGDPRTAALEVYLKSLR